MSKSTASLVTTLMAAGLVWLFTGGACSDLTYNERVEGQVLNAGSRAKSRGEGFTEKVALKLKVSNATPRARQIAGSGSIMFVECMSTRCAALSQGDCVSLKCGKSARVGCQKSTDVLQCDMVGLAACPGE